MLHQLHVEERAIMFPRAFRVRGAGNFTTVKSVRRPRHLFVAEAAQHGEVECLVKQHKSPFKWRHFEPTIILLCVRWYCSCQLSYRDLEEMMKERGLTVDHVTIFRWVQQV